jgi:SAM-dependent methyltransferase
LATALDCALPVPAGPLCDLGCSVGGTTFALAQRTDQLVLGVDLNLAMLRVAASALYRGVVSYPRKRTGVVYDRRRLEVHFPEAERVDFWACDVAALPFAQKTFALAAALNLLDCVRAPRDLLAEIGRTLLPGGKTVLTSPYDWSPVATPMEAWLGGHSQRGAGRGANEPMLRALLTPGGHPAAIGTLELETEQLEVPWHVRLHDRSTVSYRVHLVVARKRPD